MRFSQKLNYDLQKRILNKKNEYVNTALKILLNNGIIKANKRNKIVEAMQNNINLNTKIINCCLKTERSRGILSEYCLSRHNFKKLIQEKKLPGLRKASW